MRLICFFDLPVETAKDRKNYRLFRKFLLKDGYLPLQESVYAKLVVNDGERAMPLHGFGRTGRRRVLSKCLRSRRPSSRRWSTLRVIVRRTMR